MAAGATGLAGLAAEGLREPTALDITRPVLPVKGLPDAFDGFRIAFLADIHYGPNTDRAFIERTVSAANSAKPDLILLGGDYVYSKKDYVAPCAECVKKLNAPHGVFFVLGNHDHWQGSWPIRKAMRGVALELVNKGAWLRRGAARIMLAGVDDLWTGSPQTRPFMDYLGPKEVCLLVSHNPEYAEEIADERIRLVLAGHTHGGQVYIPGIGAPILPTRLGQKYRAGLVRAPKTQVYVSRGIGTLPPKFRFCCRPELTIVTIESA